MIYYVLYTVGGLENGGGKKKKIRSVMPAGLQAQCFWTTHDFKIFSEAGDLQGTWLPENPPLPHPPAQAEGL